MECKELYQKIYNSNHNRIHRVIEDFNKFFNELNADIEGQESYIHNIQVEMENLSKFPHKIILDKKGLNFPNKSKFEEDDRFLFFYQSGIYNGELKIDTSTQFIKQINSRTKDIYVKACCIVESVKPAFEEEENLIFKIDHSEYKNIYFAVVKIAPQKYSFYYFYDLLGLVNIYNVISSFKEKVFAIKSDLYKNQQIYTPENIKEALILKEYQQVIINEEKNLQTILNERNKIFNILDDLKTDLQTLDSYIFSIANAKIYKNINTLYKYDRYIEENKFQYLLKLIDSSSKIFTKINKNKERIYVLEKEQEEIQKKYYQFIQKIDLILRDKNSNIFSYEDLEFLNKDIPDIIQLKNTKERIDNLNRIIQKEDKNIVGKVKLWFNSKKDELELERKNFIRILDNIFEKLSNLKKEKEHLLEEEIKQIQSQIKTLKDDIELLKQDFNEYRIEILNIITEIYKHIDKIFFEKEKESKNLKNFYSQCYKTFLINQKNFDISDNFNLQKLMLKIEMIYETGTFMQDEFPIELQDLKKIVKTNREYLDKELKIPKIYNDIILDKYSQIIAELQTVHQQNSLFRQYIETIQETLINKIKIVY